MKKLILSLLVVFATTFAVNANDFAKGNAVSAPGDEWEVVVTGFVDYYSHQPASYQTQLYAINVATNEVFFQKKLRMVISFISKKVLIFLMVVIIIFVVSAVSW